MGLVGSLEDLGLGDILQIVSLARKSGVLNLSSGETKGKIIFQDGLVVSALSSEIKKNLGLMLVEDKVINQRYLEELLAEAKGRADRGFVIKDFVAEKLKVPRARVDQVIEKEVTAVVFSFFEWLEGNFSFELMEVKDEINSLKNPWRQFVLDQGLSPQYLAMEGTRLQDERKRMQSGPAVGPLPGEREFEIQDEGFKLEPGQRGAQEEDFSSVGEDLEHYEKPKEPREKEAGEPVPVSNVITFPTPGQELRENPAAAQDSAGVKAPVPEPRGSGTKEELKAPAGPLIVAVDDEPLMLEAIVRHFQGAGYRVEKFSELGKALARIKELHRASQVPIVIADLIMPGFDQASLLGGLELLKEIKRVDARIPSIITTDYENQPAQKQAEKLKANYFFFKPKSSQLDETFSSPELINFLQILENALKTIPKISAELEARAEEKDELFDLAEELRKELGEDELFIPEPEVKKSRGLEMLRSMIQELNDPSANGQMTLLVLRFASELMNRAVIFVVTKDQVAGLGQFGIQLNGKDPEKQVRKVRIPLQEPSIFQEAIQKRIPLKKKLKPNKWNQYLIERLGGAEPKEAFVAPIVTSGKVAAILYGDNAPEDKEIGDTESLEIFLVQVGLAMEKALLERRLQEYRREEGDKEKSPI